jgi:two-component system sensor histidine kinase/response regulator
MPRLESLLANTRALFATIIVVVAAVLAAGSHVMERAAEGTIGHEARRNASAWANYVGAQMPRLTQIAEGSPPTTAEIIFLSAMRRFGDVFRFKLFSKTGHLVLLSDDLTSNTPSEDIGKHNPKAAAVLATGQPYISIEDGTGNPSRPDVYVETYVPILVNGETAAIVEVYVDQTAQAALVRQDFALFGLQVAALVLAGIALPIMALAFATRALRAQKADLEVERDRDRAGERAKAEFLANMSHEVRTPLNGVLGMAGLILDTPLNDEQRQYADTIVQSGEALLTVLNDVLDFSKIEAGKLEIERHEFGVVSMLDGAVELFAQQAHAKNLDIPTFSDTRIPGRLVGDDGRVRQVMLNLISNAIKFTTKGGVAVEASVNMTQQADGRIVLRFEVADTGIGIPDDKLDSIFGQFEQVDGSTTRRYGGTGLGLAISKRLVELMGGEIGVEQRPEGGSLFWFTVPFDEGRSRHDWSEDIAGFVKGCRILIVDDNAVNRLVFEKQLAALGAEVTTAVSAESAMRRIAQAGGDTLPYDVMIIDHMMPGTDGLDLAQIIRAMPGGDAVKLVLSSSSGMFNSHSAARKHGFDAALPKPLRPGALIRCIHGMTDGARERAPERPTVPVLAVTEKHVRILAAEDNRANQQLITAILRTGGYQVDVAANGIEAVEALHNLPYDLVLMDIQMPEMDGYEATRKIRETGGVNADIPIIGTSAHAMSGDRDRALAAGMNDYLTKPIEREQLFEAIARWAPRTTSAPARQARTQVS